MTVTEHQTENTSSDAHDDEKTKASTTDSKTAETEDTTGPEAVEAEGRQAESTVEKARRRVSISLRALLFAAVTCALVGTACILAWLYIGAQGKLAEQAREANNNKRAEQIALDYAVRAAKMDYQNLNGWKVELVKGTSPELKEKLTKASNEMEQILTPLQWNSTARPLAAKVRSDTGGTYVVDTFVSVLTKTMQAPEGLQSTATYSITIDSNKDWQISDVGGIAAALGSK